MRLSYLITLLAVVALVAVAVYVSTPVGSGTYINAENRLYFPNASDSQILSSSAVIENGSRESDFKSSVNAPSDAWYLKVEIHEKIGIGPDVLVGARYLGLDVFRTPDNQYETVHVSFGMDSLSTNGYEVDFYIFHVVNGVAIQVRHTNTDVFP